MTLIRKEVFHMDFGKYIAHRGLHSELVPENSLTAFRLAVEKCLSIGA